MSGLFLPVLAAILGYALGSFPSAFLLVRWKTRADIRQTGSGNVGALNSYTVTGSHLIGGTVLLLDLLKGLLAVALAGLLPGTTFATVASAGIGALIGHNYPVWLGGKGGRGLATAAGVMLAIAWVIVPLWGLVWLIGFVLWRDVNIGNALACITGLAVAAVIPWGASASIVPDGIPADEFKVFAILLFGILLLRLVDPVRRYIADRYRNS